MQQVVLHSAFQSGLASRQEALDRLQQQAQWKAAQDEFTPLPSLSSTIQRQRVGATGAAATTAQLTAGLNWTLPTGTRLDLSATPSTSRSAPDASTRQLTRVLQITQHLLKGAGPAAGFALEQARLAERIGGFQRAQALDDVYVAVSSAWFDAVLARQQVMLARQALERVVRSRDINESLHQAGRLAQVDLLQSDADVAQAELALEQAGNAAQAALSALLQLLGPELASCRPDEVLLPDVLSDVEAAQPEVAAAESAQAVQQALDSRSDLKLAQAALEAARLGVAQVADQGRAALDLAFKVQASSPAAAASERLVSLTWELPLDRSALRLAQTQAQLDLRRAELGLQDLERQVRREVADALRDAAFAQRQWRLSARTVDLNRRKLDAEAERFRAGKSSGFQLSAAQDALREAESAQAQAALAMQRGQLALDRAMGRVAARRQALLPLPDSDPTP